jgi:hypothetical protein
LFNQLLGLSLFNGSSMTPWKHHDERCCKYGVL